MLKRHRSMKQRKRTKNFMICHFFLGIVDFKLFESITWKKMNEIFSMENRIDVTISAKNAKKTI